MACLNLKGRGQDGWGFWVSWEHRLWSETVYIGVLSALGAMWSRTSYHWYLKVSYQGTGKGIVPSSNLIAPLRAQLSMWTMVCETGPGALPFLAIMSVQTRGHHLWVDSDIDLIVSRSPHNMIIWGPLLLPECFCSIASVRKWEWSQSGMVGHIYTLHTPTDRRGSGVLGQSELLSETITTQTKEKKKRSFFLYWFFHLTLTRVHPLT